MRERTGRHGMDPSSRVSRLHLSDLAERDQEAPSGIRRHDLAGPRNA